MYSTTFDVLYDKSWAPCARARLAQRASPDDQYSSSSYYY